MDEPACPGCRRLLKRVAELEARNRDLEARLRELEARLGINSTNSSLPPSANPPVAPKPVVKQPSGRKPGGQPGHPPHQKMRFPADRMQRVVDHGPPAMESWMIQRSSLS